MSLQFEFTTEGEAKQKALQLSETGKEKYGAVILSNGKYYVEDTTPFIRNHESLIAQYEKGKLYKG